MLLSKTKGLICISPLILIYLFISLLFFPLNVSLKPSKNCHCAISRSIDEPAGSTVNNSIHMKSEIKNECIDRLKLR